MQWKAMGIGFAVTLILQLIGLGLQVSFLAILAAVIGGVIVGYMAGEHRKSGIISGGLSGGTASLVYGLALSTLFGSTVADQAAAKGLVLSSSALVAVVGMVALAAGTGLGLIGGSIGVFLRAPRKDLPRAFSDTIKAGWRSKMMPLYSRAGGVGFIVTLVLQLVGLGLQTTYLAIIAPLIGGIGAGYILGRQRKSAIITAGLSAGTASIVYALLVSVLFGNSIPNKVDGFRVSLPALVFVALVVGRVAGIVLGLMGGAIGVVLRRFRA